MLDERRNDIGTFLLERAFAIRTRLACRRERFATRQKQEEPV